MLFSDTFIHHCEVIPKCGGGQTSREHLWNTCKNNPDHLNFNKVSDFKRKYLEDRNHERFTDEEKEYIRLMIDSTGMITVKSLSKDRPQTFPRSKIPYPLANEGISGKERCGTGYVPFQEVKAIQDQPCPCYQCKKSDTPRENYWEIVVSTSAHVVFDDTEAETAVVDLFFDDEEDRKDVRCIYGVSVKKQYEERHNTDYCLMMCVTHDGDLANTLNRTMEMKKCFSGIDIKEPTGFMISHPHGMSKRVSLGVVDQKCYLPDHDSFLVSLRGQDVKFEPCGEERVEQSSRKPMSQMREDIFSNYYELARMLQLINQSNDLSKEKDFKTNREAFDHLILLFRLYNKVSNNNAFRQEPNAIVYAINLLDEITQVLYPSQRRKIEDFEESIKKGCNETDREPIWPKLFNALCTMICSLPENGFVTLESTGLQVSHFQVKKEFTRLESEDGNSLLFLIPDQVITLRRHFFGDKKRFWGVISPVLLVSTDTGSDEIIKSVARVDALFLVPNYAEANMQFECFSCLSYSMAACPGSSGARVCALFTPPECEIENLFEHNHHFGYDPDENQYVSGRVSEGNINLSLISTKRIKIYAPNSAASQAPHVA